MSLTTVAEPGNADARETMRRYLYWRAWRVGATPTRSFLVALIAWRIGDLPARMSPEPTHYGMTADDGRAWAGAVEDWLADAAGKVEPHD